MFEVFALAFAAVSWAYIKPDVACSSPIVLLILSLMSLGICLLTL